MDTSESKLLQVGRYLQKVLSLRRKITIIIQEGEALEEIMEAHPEDKAKIRSLMDDLHDKVKKAWYEIPEIEYQLSLVPKEAQKFVGSTFRDLTPDNVLEMWGSRTFHELRSYMDTYVWNVSIGLLYRRRDAVLRQYRIFFEGGKPSDRNAPICPRFTEYSLPTEADCRPSA